MGRKAEERGRKQKKSGCSGEGTAAFGLDENFYSCLSTSAKISSALGSSEILFWALSQNQ